MRPLHLVNQLVQAKLQRGLVVRAPLLRSQQQHVLHLNRLLGQHRKNSILPVPLCIAGLEEVLIPDRNGLDRSTLRMRMISWWLKLACELEGRSATYVIFEKVPRSEAHCLKDTTSV